MKDRKSRDAKKKTKSDIYLDETPFIFYVLFDRVYDGVGAPTSTLRIRGWCVNARTDEGWRSLIGKFLQAREEEHLNPPEGKRVKKRHNLQLHPPIGWDNSTVVNKLGNLDMTRALVLDVHFEDPPAGEQINARWEVARLDCTARLRFGCLLGAYVPGTNPTRPEDESKTDKHGESAAHASYEDAPAAANEAGVSDAVTDASELDALPDDFRRVVVAASCSVATRIKSSDARTAAPSAASSSGSMKGAWRLRRSCGSIRRRELEVPRPSGASCSLTRSS